MARTYGSGPNPDRAIGPNPWTKDFLAGKTFKSLEEAQAAIDDWVVEYNTVRPHQGIGMAPPIRRFVLAVAEPIEVIIGEDEPPAPESVEVATEPGRVTRKIGRDGRISLANFRYDVGRSFTTKLPPHETTLGHNKTKPTPMKMSSWVCRIDTVARRGVADSERRPAG